MAGTNTGAQFGGVQKMKNKISIVGDTSNDNDIDEIIQMALSDDVSFSSIKKRFGLNEHEVKKLMRKSISSKSYIRWRKRVRGFSDRREFYK